MASTNLIIAIVFAAVFGTALIWLLLYLLHRYIHQQCLDLDHWFHNFISHHISFSPCEHGDELRRSKSRSRSARRQRSRERDRHDDSRRQYRSRDMERDTDRRMENHWLNMVPVMPMGVPMPTQPWNQPYYPSLGWHGQTPIAGPTAYQNQMTWPQLPAQAAPVPPYPMPVNTPPQPLPQAAPAIPEPAYQERQQPYSEVASDVYQESQPERPAQKPKPALKPARRVNEVNYIHICDEYPPMVLEAIQKSAPEPPPSSSSSSDVSGTTEEIPRDSIPRAKAHFADDPPHRTWNEHTMSPRQWMSS